MQNRLEILHISQYPYYDLEDKKKQQSLHFILINSLNQNNKKFMEFLDEEYGIKSLNYLKGCGVYSMFWFKPSGSGKNIISSCIHLHEINNETVILFDDKIKQQIEIEVNIFNIECGAHNKDYNKI